MVNGHAIHYNHKLSHSDKVKQGNYMYTWTQLFLHEQNELSQVRCNLWHTAYQADALPTELRTKAAQLGRLNL